MCLCSFTAPARSTNSHTHSYTGGRGRRARCQPAHQERHSASYPKRPAVFIRSAFSHIHSHHNETALRSNFRFSVLPGDNLTRSQSCGLNRQPSDYLAVRNISWATAAQKITFRKTGRIGDDVGLLLKASFVLMTANVAADNTVVHCGKNWARMNICAGWWCEGTTDSSTRRACWSEWGGFICIAWLKVYSCLLTEQWSYQSLQKAIQPLFHWSILRSVSTLFCKTCAADLCEEMLCR